MGWWQKLFGKSQEGKSEAAACGPAILQVLPGRLSVRVYTHTIPNGPTQVPCWTYVTEGLWKIGQKDFIFSLRRQAGEAPTNFPRDPLDFLAQVYELASQGRRVDVGDYTCFQNPAGFLGKDKQIGFVYIPPEGLHGLPPGTALTAVLLTADEAAVVPAIGSYRVLTLLGQANRYYPCPPWSDRHRPSVLSPEDLSQSLLAKIPSGYFRGATVRTFMEPIAPAHTDRERAHSGADISLRLPMDHLPRLQEKLAHMPPHGGCTFLTDPDPEANVRLVWRPGQQRIETITPPGSDGSCMTGGFLAFLYGGPFQDGGQILEDGFAMMLSPATWTRVLEALRTGKSVQVSAAAPGQMGLTLEWTATPLRRDWATSPQEPAKQSSVFDVAQLFLYQPDEVLQQRIANVEIWTRYIKQVTETASDYWAAQPVGRAQTVTLIIAVKPGGKSRFWLDFYPGGQDTALVTGLLGRLQELPVPVVRQGPVAVAIHATLWGGKHGGWEFLPKEWQKACGQKELLVPDEILAMVWPD